MLDDVRQCTNSSCIPSLAEPDRTACSTRLRVTGSKFPRAENYLIAFSTVCSTFQLELLLFGCAIGYSAPQLHYSVIFSPFLESASFINLVRSLVAKQNEINLAPLGVSSAEFPSPPRRIKAASALLIIITPSFALHLLLSYLRRYTEASLHRSSSLASLPISQRTLTFPEILSTFKLSLLLSHIMYQGSWPFNSHSVVQ